MYHDMNGVEEEDAEGRDPSLHRGTNSNGSVHIKHCWSLRISIDRRDYNIPESLSAFCKMVSFTAAKTSRMFEVSVACVRLLEG